LNADIPIRIGVNAGSLDKDILEKYGDATPEALVDSALLETRYLQDVNFNNIKISVKHSNVPSMINSYRLLAEKVEYPLHLGVTEAGPLPGGLIKSIAGISTLLSEGIGDTIRLSLTTDPIEEAKYGRQLLEYLNLRERKSLDLIACPSCGRAEVDVIQVASEAQAALEKEGFPLQVAVMGCVVNGPGEARSADLGIAAGKGRGHLFIKGQVVKVVKENDMVEALVKEGRLLAEEGVEARLAAADKNAATIAAQDAKELIDSQGDINDFIKKTKSVIEISTNTDIEN
jgi:(E)-4-hydroxy-3-methylbut-2-enyl-diphosphate synthase